MIPEGVRRAEVVMESEIAALDAGPARLSERLPGGPETQIPQYRGWLHAELTYISNAIEESTFSSVETGMIVKNAPIISDKSLREHLEARDHAISWDYATDMVEAKVSIETTDRLEPHRLALYSTNQHEYFFVARCVSPAHKQSFRIR